MQRRDSKNVAARQKPAVGVIRLDTGALRQLQPDLADDAAERGSLRPHLVVVVIAILFLIYIAVAAWLVSEMPEMPPKPPG